MDQHESQQQESDFFRVKRGNNQTGYKEEVSPTFDTAWSVDGHQQPSAMPSQSQNASSSFPSPFPLNTSAAHLHHQATSFSSLQSTNQPTASSSYRFEPTGSTAADPYQRDSIYSPLVATVPPLRRSSIAPSYILPASSSLLSRTAFSSSLALPALFVKII